MDVSIHHDPFAPDDLFDGAGGCVEAEDDDEIAASFYALPLALQLAYVLHEDLARSREAREARSKPTTRKRGRK